MAAETKEEDQNHHAIPKRWVKQQKHHAETWIMYIILFRSLLCAHCRHDWCCHCINSVNLQMQLSFRLITPRHGEGHRRHLAANVIFLPALAYAFWYLLLFCGGLRCHHNVAALAPLISPNRQGSWIYKVEPWTEPLTEPKSSNLHHQSQDSSYTA
jgi:hypothetical protein